MNSAHYSLLGESGLTQEYIYNDHEQIYLGAG